jgi:hypothetical protein
MKSFTMLYVMKSLKRSKRRIHNEDDDMNEIERLSKIVTEKSMIFGAHAMMNIAGLTNDELIKRRAEYDLAQAEKWKAEKNLLEAKLAFANPSH